MNEKQAMLLGHLILNSGITFHLLSHRNNTIGLNAVRRSFDTEVYIKLLIEPWSTRFSLHTILPDQGG